MKLKCYILQDDLIKIKISEFPKAIGWGQFRWGLYKWR